LARTVAVELFLHS